VLLMELLQLELAYRRRAGERPTLADYLPRFPGDEALLRRAFEGASNSHDGGDPATWNWKPAPPAEKAASTVAHPPADGEAEGGAGASRELAATVAAAPTMPGYEILGELGRGAFGVVYKAWHARLKRVTALKMILSGEHAGEAELARFKTETDAIARLQHPHIVQIYEVDEHNGAPYFALEFCAGGGLDKKLAGAPLPPGEAARLVETLAGAVQAAHDRHVLHRDLKPANVLLTEDGRPKVTDFGLAKKLDDAGQTQSGAVMGTPSYMAPEQAAGAKAVGPAADV
jgi:serine/threonine protein kinase